MGEEGKSLNIKYSSGNVLFWSIRTAMRIGRNEKDEETHSTKFCAPFPKVPSLQELNCLRENSSCLGAIITPETLIQNLKYKSLGLSGINWGIFK
jgi:hypothetical protein